MRDRQKQRNHEKQRNLLHIGGYMERDRKVIEIPDPTGLGTIRKLELSNWLTETRTEIKKVNKMKRENLIASVALDAATKSNLEIVAKNMGVSISRLFKEAIGFYLSFDPGFRDATQKLAKDLGVLSPFIIERLALAHWAEMAADEEIAGGPIPRALMEFAPGQTSNQFYDAWKERKVKLSQVLHASK